LWNDAAAVASCRGKQGQHVKGRVCRVMDGLEQTVLDAMSQAMAGNPDGIALVSTPSMLAGLPS
jgi:hypothetical protein